MYPKDCCKIQPSVASTFQLITIILCNLIIISWPHGWDVHQVRCSPKRGGIVEDLQLRPATHCSSAVPSPSAAPDSSAISCSSAVSPNVLNVLSATSNSHGIFSSIMVLNIQCLNPSAHSSGRWKVHELMGYLEN